MQAIVEFFNSRNSGEQVLMLFVAGVLIFGLGVQIGRAIRIIVGS